LPCPLPQTFGFDPNTKGEQIKPPSKSRIAKTRRFHEMQCDRHGPSEGGEGPIVATPLHWGFITSTGGREVPFPGFHILLASENSNRYFQSDSDHHAASGTKSSTAPKTAQGKGDVGNGAQLLHANHHQGKRQW